MLSELIVAGVVGVMLFFTVAVAPGIFKVLPQQWASVYVRNFFPRYYAVLGAACLIAAVIDAPQAVRMAAAISSVLFAMSPCRCGASPRPSMPPPTAATAAASACCTG